MEMASSVGAKTMALLSASISARMASAMLVG